jgi:hypothetical protein
MQKINAAAFYKVNIHLQAVRMMITREKEKAEDRGMSAAWPLPPPTSLGQCLERLPARARSKYSDLKAQVDDGKALVAAVQARYVAVQTTYAETARRRSYAAGNRDAAKVAELDGELAALHRKVDQLATERARRNATHVSAEQTISRLSNFILAMFSGADFPPPPPYPDVVPGCNADESLPDALARVRAEVMALKGEAQRVRLAPVPLSETKRAIAAEVDKLAAQGRPRLTLAPGGKVELHMPDMQVFAPPGQALSAPAGSASKLMAWLHRDKILAELVADLAEPRGAIASAKRPALLADIEARLYALEIRGALGVADAGRGGLEVHRRADASPWAVLYEAEEEMPLPVAAE